MDGVYPKNGVDVGVDAPNFTFYILKQRKVLRDGIVFVTRTYYRIFKNSMDDCSFAKTLEILLGSGIFVVALEQSIGMLQNP